MLFKFLIRGLAFNGGLFKKRLSLSKFKNIEFCKSNKIPIFVSRKELIKKYKKFNEFVNSDCISIDPEIRSPMDQKKLK